jgi:hypothetical protein
MRVVDDEGVDVNEGVVPKRVFQTGAADANADADANGTLLLSIAFDLL